MATTVAASNNLQFTLINQSTGKPNELYMLNVGQATNTVLLKVESAEGSLPELYSSIDGNANKDNYTLALIFHQHVLEEGSLDQVAFGGEQAENWNLTAVKEGDQTVLYFLYAGTKSLKKCNLLLYQLAVNANFSTSSNMELRYRLKGGQADQCQQVALNILNHQGIAKSPLRLWLDTPKLSTQKGKKQSLQLRLLNTSGGTLDISRLRLQMVLDVHETKMNSPEALLTKDEFIKKFKTGTAVQAADLGDKEARTVDYQGIVNFNKKSEKLAKSTLDVNGLLTIKLENFEPCHAPGTSPIQLRYFNVKGYWDGELEVTVQRTAYMEVPNSDVTIDLSKDRYLITNQLALEENLWVRKKVDGKLRQVIVSSNGDIRASGSVMGKQIKVKLPNEAKDDQFADLVPSGTIVMWSGATPPKGWALCDGTQVGGRKTPNLSGRFVVGYGQRTPNSRSDKSKIHNYKLKELGGYEEVTLSINQMATHTHTIEKKGGIHSHSFDLHYYSGNYRSHPAGSGDKGRVPSPHHEGCTKNAGGHTHEISETGESHPHENRPPYYALAYIIKL